MHLLLDQMEEVGVLAVLVLIPLWLLAYMLKILSSFFLIAEKVKVVLVFL